MDGKPLAQGVEWWHLEQRYFTTRVLNLSLLYSTLLRAGLTW